MATIITNQRADSGSSDQSDGHLVERFITVRDQIAFAELVRRHSSVVLGVCRRVLNDSHDIDDVFQATFLVFVRNAARIRKRTSLASWLYGVAYRLSLRVARQKQRRRETILVDDISTDDDLFGKLETRHDEHQLDAELNGLPDRYRQVLVLRFLTGKSTTEIAGELSTTIGAVEGLLKRGKDELRRRLLRRGVSLGAALALVQATQAGAEAAVAQSLIQTTIQASLAWKAGSTSLPIDPISHRAVELAGKEIIAMTVTTKTTLAVGLTFGTLIAGIGGASFSQNRAGGELEAADIVTTLATGNLTDRNIEFAAITADPKVDAKPATPEAVVETKRQSQPQEVNAGPPISPSARVINEIAKWNFKQNWNPKVLGIKSALRSPSDVIFNDLPLTEALKVLKATHDIDIRIDQNALDKESIAIDTPINLVVNGVSLRSVLRLMLDKLSLDYVIKNDSLMITTKTEEQRFFETVIYDTRLLTDVDSQDLIRIITETIEPEAWQSSGMKEPKSNQSKGTIIDLESRKALVIRQTQRVHDQIIELFEQLDRQDDPNGQHKSHIPFSDK